MPQRVEAFNSINMKCAFVLILLLLCPIFVLAEERVDINTASQEQLETLIGIGAVKAQAIIDARPFSSVDDLLKVKGIGEKTLQKIKEQGLACVDCAQSTQKSEIQNPKSETNSNDENSNVQNMTTQSGDVGLPAGSPTSGEAAYPGGIFLNEILPSPEGADEENEWIELFNSNDFDVDLSGWKIQDSTGTQTTYVIPKNTGVAENGFLVFKRPDTKMTLNNDEDALTLLYPDGKTADSASYVKATANQSYNKTDGDWRWSLTLTPGATNIITAIQPKTSSKNLPKAKKSDKNNTSEAGLAGLSQASSVKNKISNGKSPWFLFFTALAITIVSATSVLLFKLKFLKNERT